MAVDVEKILRPVDNPIPPFPPKLMTLAGGEQMVIRQVGREDIPDILPHVEPLIHVERDYYDIVAVRLYSELLAYYRYRVQDEYVLVAHHIDIMGQKEVLIVAESPIGFRRWMIEYGLEKRFSQAHELGGVPSWALTREIFNNARDTLVVGRRPVPEALLKKAQAAILPPTDPPCPPADLLAATRSLYDSTGTALMSNRWKQEGRMARKGGAHNA
ncbi:MAG: hypothetical protein HY814_01945 [Candidatus Riflebacteria bacterium]|nr:hypothetical protein [Candidatus Riflebacteria bacterium]